MGHEEGRDRKSLWAGGKVIMSYVIYGTLNTRGRSYISVSLFTFFLKIFFLFNPLKIVIAISVENIYNILVKKM